MSMHEARRIVALEDRVNPALRQLDAVIGEVARLQEQVARLLAKAEKREPKAG